jgi:hypothetical protein
MSLKDEQLVAIATLRDNIHKSVFNQCSIFSEPSFALLGLNDRTEREAQRQIQSELWDYIVSGTNIGVGNRQRTLDTAISDVVNNAVSAKTQDET